MAALDNAIREVAALGQTSRAAALPGGGAPAVAAPGVPSLAPGVRVLDLVTGKIGVIQSVAIQSITIPTT